MRKYFLRFCIHYTIYVIMVVDLFPPLNSLQAFTYFTTIVALISCYRMVIRGFRTALKTSDLWLLRKTETTASCSGRAGRWSCASGESGRRPQSRRRGRRRPSAPLASTLSWARPLARTLRWRGLGARARASRAARATPRRRTGRRSSRRITRARRCSRCSAGCTARSSFWGSS